jgi:hypothetical protein
MTTTCLPPAAYYHLNRTNESVKPRIKEPEDPSIIAVLENLDTKIATTKDWESAFVLVFGQRAFEEAYHCVDWTTSPSEWAGDAYRFGEAFSLSDAFVASVMHRLFPFQYREMIPALTHALMSWCWRRERPLPYRLSDDDAIHLLNYARYDNMAEWLEEQQ